MTLISDLKTAGGLPLIEWFPPTELPEPLNKRIERFSVDVLVYCPKSKEHTIGWYDYKQDEWLFLCREVNFKNGWQWRYLTDETDRFKPQKREHDKKNRSVQKQD